MALSALLLRVAAACIGVPDRRRKDFIVREASPADRDGLFTAVSAVRSAAEAALFADCLMRPVKLSEDALLHCWVAENCLGEIVGVAAAIEDFTTLTLVELLVEPLARSRGVGRKLLNIVREAADGRDLPLLAIVRMHERAGLDWLCDRGFAPAKLTNGRPACKSAAFPDGDDAIVLSADPFALVRIAE